MTEKLYYKDAYISSFEAIVLSCTPITGGFEIVLDKTALFPEEGGQSSDKGYIGEARVLDAREREGIIYHKTDKPLAVGEVYQCTVDFEQRLEKMRLHTAEHMACGVIHKHFGYENVGFHLGEDFVTFDISAPMTRAELDFVEDEVNLAVMKNLAVRAYFPSEEELAKISYRSKLELTEGVRIVTVDGVDSCACCAPHVNSTGEIGVIKLLDFEMHRGGTRIYLTAGKRALLDYRKRYELTKRISALTSEPQAVVDTAVESLIAERDELRFRLKESELTLVRSLSELAEPTGDSFVFLLPEVCGEAMREFANEIMKKTDSVIVALVRCGDAYRFVLARRGADVSALVKAANAALSGRGGGRGAMASGTFSASLETIKKYFLELSN